MHADRHSSKREITNAEDGSDGGERVISPQGRKRLRRCTESEGGDAVSESTDTLSKGVGSEGSSILSEGGDIDPGFANYVSSAERTPNREGERCLEDAGCSSDCSTLIQAPQPEDGEDEGVGMDGEGCYPPTPKAESIDIYNDEDEGEEMRTDPEDVMSIFTEVEEYIDLSPVEPELASDANFTPESGTSTASSSPPPLTRLRKKRASRARNSNPRSSYGAGDVTKPYRSRWLSGRPSKVGELQA
ncbi:hypothetical protein FQN49_008790 [Arthroderma sp. PD_2]|nr:hypothetical protein FQN49_008790 [Arthroderma sp. PD_2]